MSVRHSLLPVVDLGRRIYGKVLGMVTSQLTIRTRTYSEGIRSPEALYTDVDVVLGEYYEIREATTREVESSGGKFEVGDIIVGPITPSDGDAVGYTEEQLAPKPTVPAVDILYLVTGAHAGTYRRKALKSTDPFEYFLVLGRVRD